LTAWRGSGIIITKLLGSIYLRFVAALHSIAMSHHTNGTEALWIEFFSNCEDLL
jgi:hypothetical protein